MTDLGKFTRRLNYSLMKFASASSYFFLSPQILVIGEIRLFYSWVQQSSSRIKLYVCHTSRLQWNYPPVHCLSFLSHPLQGTLFQRTENNSHLRVCQFSATFLAQSLPISSPCKDEGMEGASWLPHALHHFLPCPSVRLLKGCVTHCQ